MGGLSRGVFEGVFSLGGFFAGVLSVIRESMALAGL